MANSTDASKSSDPDAVPLYFYGADNENGYLSQMHKSSFEEDGVVYTSCEHYFQAAKAKKFCDDESLRAILHTKNPKTAKRLGRKVKNFDAETWNEMSREVVFEANILKFTRSNEARTLRLRLVATKGRPLCEASPKDKIWGIGCTQAKAEKNGEFPGKNYLGKALEKVRATLLEGAAGDKTGDGMEQDEGRDDAEALDTV
ncbi:uncharacterized protein J4E92_001595 [Alternaria infectoria]|uniref:uncharacterized protein n=1 Tax=Alternaria viburni TaxID=566460 RepID=UPI0020C2C53A|nr:uncharacterized protein J4E79_008126 [Alternaria viburni]XP_051356237.1 uncharacterized protein J4E92_001595 [Alternaria infectoria]KAI4655061.1 hypothetical protein J4E79_008126 [Alternaria viburni]KAI4936870.1 hypothetical protein J4E92_001595 [Alternaria infectoria]